MNCKDMMQIPELGNVLCLRAGETGLERSIRWIYFADCLSACRASTVWRITYMEENS
mgnify:CR=1 FL=1